MNYARALRQHGLGQASTDAGQETSPLGQTIDFATWAICLPRWVLRCRTKMAWHLASTFSASRLDLTSPPTTTFPLPLPFCGIFSSSGPGLSRKRLLTLARKRLLNLIVVVINVEALGRFPLLNELQRRPNSWQRSCLDFLWSLILVCGDGQERFPVAPGRSGPELGAMIYQLETFASQCPDLGSGYFEHKPIKFKEDPNLISPEDHPELQPYKSLNASRLRIVGEGQWPLMDFLQGPFWLPYMEPRFLWHEEDIDFDEVPNFRQESRAENLKLCQLWDSKNLLRLFRSPLKDGHFSRVFNAHKSEICDRQIGDRRLPNPHERGIDGPSGLLPQGYLLANLRIEPFRQQVLASVTDRRDFYHQAMVTSPRSRSNMLPFKFKEDELIGLTALGLAQEAEASSKKGRRPRDETGDGFGKQHRVEDRDGWYGAFGSLFQGDHLGVEFALSAHECLLQRGGLLVPDQRLQGKMPFPMTDTIEGLIIDDYFVISKQGLAKDRLSSAAATALARARLIYDEAKLLGSAEKDIEAACTFKAAGAEVISTMKAVNLGITTVGAPLAKRIGLSTLSLRAARLPSTTAKLLSRLAGNWVSVLLYRRCCNAWVDDLFRAAADAEDSGQNCAVHLSRKVADELTRLAILAPIIVSNIAVHQEPKIYASDASLGKGAFVSTEVPADVSEAIWLGSDKRGSYVTLDGFPRNLLAAAGEETYDDGGLGEAALELGPSRALLLYYDFVEFFGGSARISKCLVQRGFTVAPPLDLDQSEHYNLSSPRLLEWCFYMLETGRFRSFMTEPPCTTFSAAAYPALRSYQIPMGFDPTDDRTNKGNLLALRSFALLKVGRRYNRPCGKEQPRLSKMRWLPAWAALLRLGFREAVVASCQFGSPHKKEFVFLFYGVRTEDVETRCPGGHQHVKIEGSLTKGSAIYTWDLARHLAKHFARALMKPEFKEETLKADGLESPVVNDVLAASHWSYEKTWSWKKKSHINVLEASAGFAVIKHVATTKMHTRFNSLLDSRVAKGALAKGRSTARGLQRICKVAACYQLCADVYPGWSFAPTRLNVADDPTRDAPLRKPASCGFSSQLGLRCLQELHSVPLTRYARYASNWVRLVILALLLDSAHASVPSPVTFKTHPWILNSWFDLGFSLSLDFAWTLPWISSLLLFLSSLSLIGSALSSRLIGFPCRALLLWGLLFLAIAPVFRLGFGPVAVEAMVPASRAEAERAATRVGTCLRPTRVARKETLIQRQKLFDDFGNWLFAVHGIILVDVLSAKPPDPEEVCRLLTLYGQEMFLTGKAYGRFAETINAVATARPIIKKQLGPAWDLAFAWLADEPFQHHLAMPLSVLLSMMTLALLWGWPLEAAILGLTWSGILRIGEVMMATRADLVLPIDAAPGTTFALLRIRMPKTRGRAARHQAARVDPVDIVRLLTGAFANLSPDKKLWPYSAATLRKRFSALLTGLGLQCRKENGKRGFDLGSLRPGGATYLLLKTEDSELVRRRGRWVSAKVCEIYLQEVMYLTYTEKLPAAVRLRIQTLAGAFSRTLECALKFLQSGIPTCAWHQAYQTRDAEELGAGGRDGQKFAARPHKTGQLQKDHMQAENKEGRRA